MDKSAHNEIKGSFWNFQDKNAAEIEREIQVTRADLDETVNALQARLAPQQMIDQFLNVVRDTIRDSAPRLAESIRRNPAPAGLVAIGLGWMFIQSVNPPRRRMGYGEPFEGELSATELSDEAGEVVSDIGYKFKKSTRRMKDKARDTASQIASTTREKAGEWADTTREKAGQFADYTKEKASHLVDLTREKAGDVADYTKEKAGEMMHAANQGMHSLGRNARAGLDRAGETTKRIYHDNPVALALACLGVGAAVALSLPMTRQERKVMGEASDQFVEKAKQAGQQTMEKVQNIAEAGARAAQQEARQEGIM